MLKLLTFQPRPRGPHRESADSTFIQKARRLEKFDPGKARILEELIDRQIQKLNKIDDLIELQKKLFQLTEHERQSVIRIAKGITESQLKKY